MVTFNGLPGTFIGVFPTPSANPLDTASAVVAELPSIQASLPAGMKITLMYDSTESISASIDEVFTTIAEAVIIVVLVILLFLGSFRSVLMPVVTIPLSLIGVCFFLFLLGYSINLLSLLAMVLAIGLVVDDAIVVVENIHRHIEEGLTPMQAAFQGMQEISGADRGDDDHARRGVRAARLHRRPDRRAVPRVRAHACRRGLHLRRRGADDHADDVGARSSRAASPAASSGSSTAASSASRTVYERLVAGSLKYRPVTLMIVIVLVALTGFLFTKTSSELAPEEDSGALFALVNAPPYATSGLHPAPISTRCGS